MSMSVTWGLATVFIGLIYTGRAVRHPTGGAGLAERSSSMPSQLLAAEGTTSHGPPAFARYDWRIVIVTGAEGAIPAHSQPAGG